MDEESPQNIGVFEKLQQLLEKRFYIVLSVVALFFVVVGIVLISVFYFLQAERDNPTNTPQNNTQNSSILNPVGHSIPLESARNKLIYEEKEISFPKYKDGFVYYFSDLDSQFYRLLLETGERQVLSEPIAMDVESIHWSPDTRSAILFVHTSALEKEVWRYDFDTDSLTQLDENVRAASFSPDGQRFSYLLFDDSQAENPRLVLYSEEFDGSNPQEVVSFTQNQTVIQYVNNSLIASYLEPAEPYIQDITFFVTDTEQQTSSQLDTDGRVFGVKPSPDNTQFLSQHATDRLRTQASYELYVIDAESQDMQEIGQNIELGKAVWGRNGDFIYALSENNLISINSTTFESEAFTLPDGLGADDIDTHSLFTTNNPKVVYFTVGGLLYEFTF